MAWLEAIAIAFVTIAVAELADKTQLVTISQACRYPYAPVLAGSALALIMVTALGVLFGTVLSLYLSERLLGVTAGALFLVFGVLLLMKSLRDRAKAVDGEPTWERKDPRDAPPCEENRWGGFASTFGLVALAELGDKTQLAVIALAGEVGDPWAVFLGASLALVAVSALGVVGGRLIARRVAAARLDLVAAVLFLVLGGIFLAGALL